MEHPALVTAVTLALLLTGVVPAIGGNPSSSAQFSPATTSPIIPGGTVDPEYSVTNWVPSETWNGTTFFGNANTSQIVEVNMKGEVVWRYSFPTPTSTQRPIFAGIMVVPGSKDLLFSVINPDTLRGCYEVNMQGQLVWSYLNKTVSHDCVRLPNGDTLVDAAHAEDYTPWPYTQAEVFEVNPQGQIVWAWHAKDDFQNNPTLANVRSTDFGYWTHVNEALLLPNGNYMISPRNFNMTIVVDTTGKLLQSFGNNCASGCGPTSSFIEPHSPLPLSNGNYLVGYDGAGVVIEYNPAINRGIWQFPTAFPRPGSTGLYFMRGQQRLPNGNTLITDSNGQLVEVTQSGQIAWRLKCTCYNTAGASNLAGSPFFQGERLSYMPPSFTVSSPVSKSTYSGSVPLTVTAGFDAGNFTYSIRSNQNSTWVVRNATLIQNLYKDSLDPPATTTGHSSVSLPAGNYTFRILAGSSGYGYKAFVQQKQVNYGTQDINFLVTAPATSTTTSTSQTSSPLTTTSTGSSASSSSTTASSSTSASTSSRVTTLSSTTSQTQSSSSTHSSSTAALSTTFQTSSSSGATSTAAGGGGIPEFPYQALAAIVFAATIVTSYTIARRRSRDGPPR